MQQLSTYEINQISGGLTGLQTAALITTLPVTIPLGFLASLIVVPCILSGVGIKLGNNIADHYSGWDQTTGWTQSNVTYSHQG